MKQAVLVVSFGTTYSETREKNIGAVLRRISAAAPGLPVYEAWTSSMILRALRKRGESVDDVRPHGAHGSRRNHRRARSADPSALRRRI